MKTKSSNKTFRCVDCNELKSDKNGKMVPVERIYRHDSETLIQCIDHGITDGKVCYSCIKVMDSDVQLH